MNIINTIIMPTTKKRTTKRVKKDAINLNNKIIFIAGNAYILKKVSKADLRKGISSEVYPNIEQMMQV